MPTTAERAGTKRLKETAPSEEDAGGNGTGAWANGRGAAAEIASSPARVQAPEDILVPPAASTLSSSTSPLAPLKINPPAAGAVGDVEQPPQELRGPAPLPFLLLTQSLSAPPSSPVQLGKVGKETINSTVRR